MFHIFWLFIAREAVNSNEVTVALQEFASSFFKVLFGGVLFLFQVLSFV